MTNPLHDTPKQTSGPPLTGEDLRFILGLKLKTLRQQKGMTLQQVATRCGLSVSYLSEIEKGKKYPKAERLIVLARAVGASFDDLVSPQVDEELAPVKTVFSSLFLQGFPFELFGVDPEDLFGIATESPERSAALIRALLDVGRTYDIQVEQFLLAALRSYQQLNQNHFPELEAAAARCRAEHGWAPELPLAPELLEAVLRDEHGYRVDATTLAGDPDLRGLRSVYLGGQPPRLLVNGNLRPSQRAFVLARELGYRTLRLTGERAVTSSWIKVESFEQVLNNFKASYFGGALLIDRDRVVADLGAFFARPRWDGAALVACIGCYAATPELFFHRLTELLPRLLGLDEIYFLRFAHDGGSDKYRLTKFLNISRVPVPHAVGLDETYCRRWPALRLMRQLDERRHDGAVGAGGAGGAAAVPADPIAPGGPLKSTGPLDPTGPTASTASAGRPGATDSTGPTGRWPDPAASTDPVDPIAPIVTAQRSYFLDADAEFFVITMARPLALASDATSSVSIGFLLDEAFKATVRFWDDPAIPRVVVNLTCERCRLSAAECQERGAPPVVWRRLAAQERKERALAALRARAEAEAEAEAE